MKCGVIIILSLLSLQTFSQSFDLICESKREEIALFLNKTPLNDFEGTLYFDKKEIPVSLKKASTKRGVTHFRDHDFRKDIKVDFNLDLSGGKSALTISTQFNRAIIEDELLECE